MDLRIRAAALRHGRVYENVDPEFKWEQGDSSDADDVLRFVLPGFRKEELKVQVDNHGTLRVSGERQVQGNRWARISKDFPLPEAYDTSEIRARFGDGVLIILLPKFQPAGSYPAEETTSVSVPPAQGPQKQREDEEKYVPGTPARRAPTAPKETEQRQRPRPLAPPTMAGKEESVAAGREEQQQQRQQPQTPSVPPPPAQKLGSLPKSEPGEARTPTAPRKTQQESRTLAVGPKLGKEKEDPDATRQAFEEQSAWLPIPENQKEGHARKAPPTEVQEEQRKPRTDSAGPLHPAAPKAQKDQPLKPIEDKAGLFHPTVTTADSASPLRKLDDALTKPKVDEEDAAIRPNEQRTNSEDVKVPKELHPQRRPTLDAPIGRKLPTEKAGNGVAKSDKGTRLATFGAAGESQNNKQLITNIAVAVLVLLCFWAYISHTFKMATTAY